MGTGIAVSVWGLIIAGILVLGLFIGWQAINPREPLVPLSLFSDRNFSVSNVAISAMGVVAISMAVPADPVPAAGGGPGPDPGCADDRPDGVVLGRVGAGGGCASEP